MIAVLIFAAGLAIVGWADRRDSDCLLALGVAVSWLGCALIGAFPW